MYGLHFQRLPGAEGGAEGKNMWLRSNLALYVPLISSPHSRLCKRYTNKGQQRVQIKHVGSDVGRQTPLARNLLCGATLNIEYDATNYQRA